MTSTVRSVRVVMEADVAGYIANIEAAGKATDQAFSKTGEQLKVTDSGLKAVDTSAKKTQQSTERLAVSSDKLLGSLDRQTGAITKNTRAMVAKGLADKNVLQTADRLGLSLTDVTQAALGNDDALKRVNTQLEASRSRLGYVATDEVRVSSAIRSTNTELDKAQKQFRLTARAIGDTRPPLQQTSAEVDKLSGRLRLFRDIGVTLGPALIPIAGAAIPALTSALTGLGAAAGGIGVAVLALHGIGTGLKALDAYQAAPTAANLEKLRLQMQKLGPAGAEFVNFLDGIEPKLSHLQTVARNGLFPGVEAGITDLLTRLPDVRQVVNRLSQEMGTLAKDTGSALASPEWTPFFNYVKREAAPTLDAFARSTGNVALGLANLLIAFQPLSDRFTGGMVGMTAAFANWSKGLDQNQGFQNFLDYLEKTGPDVLELLGGLAHAFAGLVHAAAPLGQSTLPVLNALLQVFGAIANSPVGPGLYAAAAGLLAYNRAAKITASTTTKVSTALTNMSKVRLASGAIGGLGLLGLSLTSVDDKLGLTSTSMDAMAGLMVGGPWGAAIGAGVGLMTDLKAASDRASSSQDALDKAFAASSTSYVDRVHALTKANQDYIDQVDEFQTHGFSNFLKHPADQLNFALSSFDGSTVVDDLGKQASVSNVALDSMNKSLVAIGTSLGNPKILAGSRSFSTLSDVATSIQPALAALGLSLNDLSVTKLSVFGQKVASNAADVRANRAAIVDWVQTNDSAAGRSQALTDAVAGLDNQLLSTAQSADAVSQALNDLLGPQLNLSAATDAWTTSLRHLSDDLDKNNHSIVGNSDAAIQNRGAIRDRVTAMTDVLSAEAAAGASSGKLTKTLQSQRQALIQAGAAAGISKADMRSYLEVLGLTPKLVSTLVKANNAQALSAIAAVQRMLANTHDRDVYIRVHTVGGSVGSHGDPGLPDAHGGSGADGATVHGPRQPYGDKMLYAVAPGEEIVSNRHGQADRNRPLLKAISDGRYGADGRTVDTGSVYGDTYSRTTPTGGNTSATPHLVLQLDTGLLYLTDSVKQLQKRLDAVSTAYDKEKSKLDSINSAMDSLSSTIADKFTVDLSSTSTGVSFDDLIAQGLDAATAAQVSATATSNVIPNQIAAANTSAGQASQLPAIIAALEHAGITGATLEQILSQESFANLLALAANPALAAQLGTAVSGDAASAHAGGQAVAQAVLGDQQRAAEKATRALHAQVETMTQEIKNLKAEAKRNSEAEQKAAAETGPANFAAALNGPAHPSKRVQ